MDALNRLSFAVAFVQESLKRLRPGDLLNRKNDLKDFCAYSASDFIALAPDKDPEQISDEDLQALQQRWWIILRAITDREEERKTWPRDAGERPMAPWWDAEHSLLTDNATKLEVTIIPVSNKEKSILIVSGTVSDVATYQLLNSLMLVGAGSILRCADPSCPMFFVRTRRQKFCSRQCAVKNAVTNYRHRPDGRKPSGKAVGYVKENYSRKDKKGREKATQKKHSHK